MKPGTSRLISAAGHLRRAFASDDGSPGADLKLAESEQRYQAVIENASDMIQSVRPDGTFEFTNGAWRTTLGYTDDDLAGMTIFQIIHPESLDHCMIDFMRAIRGETVEFLETKFVAKDGRVVPVEGSVTSRFLGDEVVATHGFFRDTTERLRARELEERAEKLEREERARYLEKMAALGKLSAGLAHELNNPAAAVQRANATLQTTIRRRDEALRGLAVSGLEPECWLAVDGVVRDARPVRADGGQPNLVELSEAEAGTEAWLEDHGIERAWELAPALAEAGVTEQALAVLASRVPTAALGHAVAWVTESLVLRESTEIIAESSRRIADLVLAIKGYSHMDRATEYDADLHEGLENTLIILGHRLRSVEVRREYDRSLPSIRMFGNTLNQVWTNILDNAIDATGGAGRIVLRTSRDGGCAVVEIEDDGKGIPADALPRIFEPFYTTKAQGEGTGLGLDTAWRIVTQEQAGSITATSEPGRTVFQVRLPITPPAGSEGAAGVLPT